MDELQLEIAAAYSDLPINVIEPLWNLLEDLNIENAASLISGYNPIAIERCINDTNFDQNFTDYIVAFKALTNAVTSGSLKASIRHSACERGFAEKQEGIGLSDSIDMQDAEVRVEDSCYFYKPFPDWSLTIVSRRDLVAWLTARGVKSGFFFPEGTEESDYLNCEHPRYAPKLAAAIKAWISVGDESSSLQGRSPKQALLKWLREHAAEFKLSDYDGKINETGIEECAKVANWKDKGGAPPTPSS